ncbi:MAG: DNA primase [Proteobacteria bacterium]|nr:DNA primase [Pseudomonadota bacterium]
MSSGDTTPGAAEEMARRVQARVEQEAAAASPPKPAVPLPDNFILDCLRANRVGDAILFNALHRGKFVFVERWGRWLKWAGHHWAEDMNDATALGEVEAVNEEYLRVEDNLFISSKDLDGDELKRNIATRKALRDRVNLLRDVSGRDRLLKCTHTTRDPLHIDGEELDQQPYLLAFKNGVVDLRSGAFRPGRPEDYILNACPIEWASLDAEAEAWEQYLLDCHAGDREMVSFLQRALGYAIMGVREDHVWFVFYGMRGRNGKDIFFKLLSAVMGGALAGTIPQEMLLETKMPRNPAAPSPDVMSLRGKRIAIAAEAEDKQRLAIGKIKQLTGGGELVGRGLQDKMMTTWLPTHLLFLHTNEIPKSKADDDAFWIRMLVVPWNVRFVDDPKTPDERKRDSKIESKLKQNLSGLAAWLVRGALEYQEKGLCPPESVITATREQRERMDDVGLFLSTCCDLEIAPEGKEPTTRIASGELLDAFNWWQHKQDQNAYLYSSKRLGEILRKKLIPSKKSNIIYYLGITLKPDVAAEFEEWQDSQGSRGEDKSKRRKLFG